MEKMDCPEEFKRMMMENDSDDDESLEKISESFICCVCRDLLYKPAVLGCGHVSCFWCVYKSMNIIDMSSCPVCRNRYHHFPYVCQTLQFLLQKMYPNAYAKREEETLGEEQEGDCFSPQLDAAASILNHQKLGSSNSQAPGENIAASNSNNTDPNMIDANRTCNTVLVGDVLCGSCNHMLFRPVVLNCGHVFCAGCIVSCENEMLICNVCEYPHPGDFPKVCLEFDQFLEEQFSTEYKQRSSESLMKQKETPRETPGTSSSSSGKQGSSGKHNLPFWAVHHGVGCDSCGMYPIIGERYKCKNCVVRIGYDLCKDCYTSLSTFPGRFNQHHTSDHEFEVISGPLQPSHDPLEVLRERYHSVSAIAVALSNGNLDLLASEINEAFDNEEDVPLPSSERDALRNRNLDLLAFHEINEAFDNEEDVPLPSSEREENQSDNPQPHHERLL